MQIYHKMFCPFILLKVASPGMRLNENYDLCVSHRFMETTALCNCALSKCEKYHFYFVKTVIGIQWLIDLD